jgi:predicted ArsR family transcriptional regulator
MADVEKLPGDSYRLTLHNCAIWAVASHYGLACTTELEFMQEVVLEATVTRVVHKVAGAYVCAYEIRPGGTTAPTSHPKARRNLTSA